MHARQAISYGRVLKTEKTYPELCFIRAFTYFRQGVRPNQARSSQNTCSFLGRGVYTRFSYLQGCRSRFLRCCHFQTKKTTINKRHFQIDMYRRFSRKKASFSDKSSPKLNNRGNWSVSTFFENAIILKKLQTALHVPLAKWLEGLQEKLARFARFPVQTRLRRC